MNAYVQRNQPPGVPAARADRRAHAPRRPGRELLVSAPPRGLRVDRARVAGLRVLDMACGEGYGVGSAGALGRAGRRRRRQPRGLRARAAALPRAEPQLRARDGRELGRARRLRRGRVPADDRARPGSRRGAAPLPSLLAPGGVVYVSTPNVLTLAPPGARQSDNPWHIREYRAARVRALCRAVFAEVELLRLFHARKLRAARAGAEARLGPRPQRAADHQAVLRPLHPGDRQRDFALRARRRPRCRARLPGGLPRVSGGSPASWRSCCTRTCPTSRASGRGRSARSGCGRRSRPATCRCSTCSRAGRRSRCR